MAQGPSSKPRYLTLGSVSLIQKLSDELNRKNLEIQKLKAELYAKQASLAGVDEQINALKRHSTEKMVEMGKELKRTRILLQQERYYRVTMQRKYGVDSGLPLVQNHRAHHGAPREQKQLCNGLHRSRESVEQVPRPAISPSNRSPSNGISLNGRRASFPRLSPVNSPSGSTPAPSTAPRATPPKRNYSATLNELAKRARLSTSPSSTSSSSNTSTGRLPNGTLSASPANVPLPQARAQVITLSDDEDDSVPVVKNCPNPSNDKEATTARKLSAASSREPQRPHHNDFGNLPFTFADMVSSPSSSTVSTPSGSTSTSGESPRLPELVVPVANKNETSDHFLGERAGIDSSTLPSLKEEAKDATAHQRSQSCSPFKNSLSISPKAESYKTEENDDQEDELMDVKLNIHKEEVDQEDSKTESLLKKPIIKIEDIDCADTAFRRGQEASEVEFVFTDGRISITFTVRGSSRVREESELSDALESMSEVASCASDVASTSSIIIESEQLSLSPPEDDDKRKVLLLPPPRKKRKLIPIDTTGCTDEEALVHHLITVVPEDYEGDLEALRQELNILVGAENNLPGSSSQGKEDEDVGNLLHRKWPSKTAVHHGNLLLDCTVTVAAKYDLLTKRHEDSQADMPREYLHIDEKYFAGNTPNRVIKIEVLPEHNKSEGGLLRACTVGVHLRPSSNTEEYIHVFYTVYSDNINSESSPWSKSDPVKISDEWVYFRFCLKTDTMEPDDYLYVAAVTGGENYSDENGFSLPSAYLEIAVRDLSHTTV